MQKIILDDWQEEFRKTKGNKILCTGRQVGKSVICSVDCGEWAVKNSGKNIMIIAAVERQAYELFDKVLDYLLNNYRAFIKAGKDRPTKSKIELKNGTRILCLPVGSSAMGIRGYTIHRLYIDEASRVPDDAFGAVTPMLAATAGDIILLSTPFGRKGYFYECWSNKNNSFSDFTRFSITTEEVFKNRKISSCWTEEQRVKSLNFIEHEKARLSRLMFSQEYVGEFVEDLMQYFSDELIRAVQKLHRERSSPFVPSLKSSSKYYLGVDVGGRGGDETTFEIIEKCSDNIMRQRESIVHVFNRTTDTERIILHLDSQWRFRKIYIDDGGMGVGIFDHLLEVPSIKRRVEAINNSKRNLVPINSIRDSPSKDDDVLHPKQTTLMKNDLYDNLLCLMERGEIELLDDPEIFQSLKSIQFEIPDPRAEKKDLIIWGDYSHITEGLIRAAWCKKDKSLNPFIA